MLKLQDSDLRTHSEVFFNAAAKGGKAALFFDDFIKNTLISLYSNTPFPKQVKLCRTVEEMIDGDFSPGEVVEMSPPELLLTLEENGKKAEFKIPLWRGSTLAHEGVMLRGAGYINGDSRKPYKTIFDYLTLLKDLGKKAKSTPFYNMSFYDEEEKCYEDKFPLAIQSKAKPCLLYLGEPSFVLHNDDGEKWLRIELKEDIGQNILIFSPMQKNRERYLLMLQHNIAEMKRQGAEVQTLLFYSNRDSFSRIDIGLAKKPSYVRDFSPAMEAQLSGPLIRRIMVECDDIAFGNVSFDDEDMKLYQEVVNKENQFSGELWQKRAQTLFNLYKGPFAKQFGIDSITNNDKKLSALSGRVLATMSAFRNMGCEVSKLTRDSLKPQFIIIHGLEQIAQLGVDVKSGRVEAFKKIINEAPEYKVYFIITTSTLEDASSLRSAIAHVLCDNLTGQMQGHLKIADYYPESCSPALGIYYCSTKEEDRCVKFKKMIFRGEVM